MSAVPQPLSRDVLFLSGNEAIARGAWQAGVRVATAYPGTPSTEILEVLSRYPDLYSEWSVNEKVSLEVAYGASLAGSRAFCAMKHVGMNVASDALMTMTLTGVNAGLVIAVADDVGLSSSQNEQDSRFWGRFAHVPVLEPSDSQEACDFMPMAYALSEEFRVPVILRLTTRICHVKGRVEVGERTDHPATGFVKDPSRWVMVPGNAKGRLPLMYAREAALREASCASSLNTVETGSEARIGFVTSGPAYMHVRESYPNAPVLKLGFSYPLPLQLVREFAGTVDRLVVVEETEPLVEMELRAAGIDCHGKDILPVIGELSPGVLRPAIAGLLGESIQMEEPQGCKVFPRPPTMCVACPHLGIYYTLAQVRNLTIAGDIGCYTLGAGHPWNALDTCLSMGASMGVALGMDKGRSESDANKRVLAVIGDSTFMHMGMQGLLDITYNRGNVTVLLLDNGAVGMTGGQDNPANGHDIHGKVAPRIDLSKLVEALGVAPERIRKVNPYELPTLFKALREEIKAEEPSVIITDQPCVLTKAYGRKSGLEVLEDKCTGCGNCVDVGCPAIHVTRRETAVKPSGKEVQLSFVRIETAACTGCDMCVRTCGLDAIVPAMAKHTVVNFSPMSMVGGGQV
jgi:indolepyruvate ferredoxin oxidoreductase alpha subunit